MCDSRIPPALDRHLVSAAHAAATTGDVALGAFEAVVDQVVHALRGQGATYRDVERVFRDVFSALGYPYARTPVGARYEALEARAVAMTRRDGAREIRQAG